MEKLSREIKSEFEGIDVPTKELDARVQKALEIAQKRERKKSSRLQAIKMNAVAVLVIGIVAVLFQSNFWDKDSTSGFGYQKGIFYNYGGNYTGIRQIAEEGRVNFLNLEEGTSNMKVQVKEAYFDSGSVMLGYQIDTETPFQGYVLASLTSADRDATDYHTSRFLDLDPNHTDQGILHFEHSDYFIEDENFELKLIFMNQEYRNKEEVRFEYTLDKASGLTERDIKNEAENQAGVWLRVDHLKETMSKLDLIATMRLPEQYGDIHKDISPQIALVGTSADGSIKVSTSATGLAWGYNSLENEEIGIQGSFAPLRDVTETKAFPYIRNWDWQNVTQNLEKDTTMEVMGQTIKVNQIIQTPDEVTIRISKGSLPVEYIVGFITLHEKNGYPENVDSYKLAGDIMELTYKVRGNPKDLEISYTPMEHFFHDLAVTVK
ncbi:hypothetical protein M3936_21095 [Sutcliffiella horikoshii]|uniref:hypothetical protein n=1 Tax=Sutcliffiella horikoshii TaxID=79883 RepID=UPI002040329A|nr:hypothetical protein [Sutcliffiella horikoshii]MCM3620065.1 hypothetical protein [Sutcliffiella horikoshii]